MLKLRVRSVTYQAEGVLSYELVDPAGEQLPSFEAGAHIDVRIPGGFSRRYSLCDAPGNVDHYRIAVLNVAGGRGGSKAMHEAVQAGSLIEVSAPPNFFPLDERGSHSILLAGGIGVTPLLAMMERLHNQKRSYEFHYCTRTPTHTAFAERLAPHVEQGIVHIHHDGGDPRNGLDVTALLRERQEGSHVYFCGPSGFMSAVRSAVAHWPKDSVHFEYFTSEVPADRVNGVENGVTEVVLNRSQRSIAVAPSQTILEALRAAGVEAETSCESGVCGTCKTKYLQGKPEHNDYLLSDEEHETQVLICCARVETGPLVLDL